MKRMLLLASVLLGAAAHAQTVLIRNATVMTVTKGTIQNGSVLIQNGKIAAIGKNLNAPADATIVDASGKFLTPGIIDCHSHTAVEGSVNEGTVSDSSMVDIKDVINPTDINIYRALAGGLTVSNVLHGSANAIGGHQTALGQEREGDVVRRRDPRYQVCAGRESEAARLSGTRLLKSTRAHSGTPLSGNAPGCGRSDKAKLYGSENLSRRVENV